MANLLSVPPELLVKIELYLDKSSHIAYTSCCKKLRIFGSLSLLSAYVVVLDTVADVESFCDSMHADLSSRKPYLHAFAMLTPSPTPQKIRALRGRLAHVLMHAPSLTSIEFGRCLEDIFAGSPSLLSAVQSLPALTELRIVSKHVARIGTILDILNAPLSSIHMDYSEDGVPDAVGRYASSLQCLSIGGRTIEATLGQFTFVHVRALHWVGALDEGAWDLADLIAKFPNLRHLSARRKRVEGRPGSLNALIESLQTIIFPYESVRLANINAQKSRAWPQLRRLTGDPGTVFLLAPLCKLDVISIIDNLEAQNSAAHIYKVVDQLEHPINILHLKYSPFWYPGLRDNIGPLSSTALPEKTPHFVTCLIVELYLHSDISVQTLQEIVAAWAPLIGRVSPGRILLHVRIVRCIQAVDSFPTSSEKYIAGEDIHSLGKSLGAHARSTQSILIKTSWHGGQATSAWSVVEQPDSTLALLEHLPFGATDDTEEIVEKLLSCVA